MAQVTNDLKSQSAAQAVSAAVQAAAVGSVSVSDQVDVVDSMQEGDNNSASDLASMKNRRRGRPPKNSNMDLSYSPPEKKLRMPLAFLIFTMNFLEFPMNFLEFP